MRAKGYILHDDRHASFAKRVVRALRNYGVSLRRIQSHTDLPDPDAESIVVVCFSFGASEKYLTALAQLVFGNRTIPILLEPDSLPLSLSHKQVLDFTDYFGDLFANEIAKLSRAILATANQTRTDTEHHGSVLHGRKLDSSDLDKLRRRSTYAFRTRFSAALIFFSIGLGMWAMWQGAMPHFPDLSSSAIARSVHILAQFILGFGCAFLVGSSLRGSLVTAGIASASASILVNFDPYAPEFGYLPFSVAEMLLSAIFAWLLRRTYLSARERAEANLYWSPAKHADNAAIDVFISYRSRDRAFARSIAESLELRGLKVWWDQSLHGGQEFGAVIIQMLQRSKAVILCHSESALQSPWVFAESGYAAEKKCLLIAKRDNADIEPPFDYVAGVSFSRKQKKAPDQVLNDLAQHVRRMEDSGAAADIYDWFHPGEFTPKFEGYALTTPGRPARGLRCVPGNSLWRLIFFLVLSGAVAAPLLVTAVSARQDGQDVFWPLFYTMAAIMFIYVVVSIRRALPSIFPAVVSVALQFFAWELLSLSNWGYRAITSEEAVLLWLGSATLPLLVTSLMVSLVRSAITKANA